MRVYSFQLGIFVYAWLYIQNLDSVAQKWLYEKMNLNPMLDQDSVK